MRAFAKALLLSLFVAAPLSAQGHPQTRQGFTISFGLGGGAADFTCEGCAGEREWGPTIYLQLGGTPRPNLVLGGEINGWSRTYDLETGGDGTFTVSTATFVVQYYPQVNSGLFLNGGIGFGSVAADIDIPGVGSSESSTTGFGFQAGLGYDIRLARNFSLTPYAKYFATVGGEWEDTSEKFNGNVFHVGLGFTWH